MWYEVCLCGNHKHSVVRLTYRPQNSSWVVVSLLVFLPQGHSRRGSICALPFCKVWTWKHSCSYFSEGASCSNLEGFSSGVFLITHNTTVQSGAWRHKSFKHIFVPYPAAACTVPKQMAMFPYRLHSYYTLPIHDPKLLFCVSHNLTWETCTILD